MSWTVSELEPFGLRIDCAPGTVWSDLPVDALHGWVSEHRVIVVRGTEPLAKGDLPGAARRLGPLLAWPFGSINELAVDADKENYLYTERAVPLHWDGAFVGTIPRYLFFRCVTAPADGTGGETVFVDTTRVLDLATDAQKARWRAQRVRYRTERVVHYGGAFEQGVVERHPYEDREVIRYAEPVADLNPVEVTPLGVADAEPFHAEMRSALYADDAVLEHSWRDGDVVVADNHALLHGRKAFADSGARHLQRVNVLGPERSTWDAVRDSVRIRRPEFMVAEIPILLIATLLAAGDSAVLASFAWWEAVIGFFLLFHFGDIINCLADRELDSVYKTHLSEAVHGLGVRNVKIQLFVTAIGAAAIWCHLGWTLGQHWLGPLALVGLLWGAQYSVGPLRLKGRGLWQITTLVGIIFVGPMLLVAGVVADGLPSWELVTAALLFGVMQEGTILVNTAEDYEEDRAAGIRTSALALGRRRTVGLAIAMVVGGGIGLIALFFVLLPAPAALYGLGLFAGALLWVVGELVTLWRRLGASGSDADALLKRAGRRMPLWITALAWTVLLTTALGFPW